MEEMFKIEKKEREEVAKSWFYQYFQDLEDFITLCSNLFTSAIYAQYFEKNQGYITDSIVEQVNNYKVMIINLYFKVYTKTKALLNTKLQISKKEHYIKVLDDFYKKAKSMNFSVDDLLNITIALQEIFSNSVLSVIFAKIKSEDEKWFGL